MIKEKLTKCARVITALVTAVALQTIIFGASAQAQPGLNKSAGAVFAMTNATKGNEIVTYARASDGTLTRLNHVEKTRGLGQGVDTDTQGPLRLSPDNRFLYAVNPGSDNISVFEVRGTQLKFLQIIPAGDQPLSLTIHGNLLYSLDGSVVGNGIRGFRIAPDGTLTELPNSFRMLSSPIAVPGEIKFSPDGQTILVTQKTTNVLLTPQNAIDAFAIGTDGYASAMPIRNASFGLRPFSLAFRNDDKLVVVEAFNAAQNLSAASSYQLNADGTITAISGSIPNGQTDVCWVLISNDGRYVYAANFGSGTISSYSLSPSGSLTLLNGAAASLGAMSQPVDIDVSADGHYLYQLLRGTGAVAALRIEADGSLTSLGLVTGGLPVADGASGLAAY
ncbi:MAG: 6-phosphogluconolactonase, cycloisomerase 2 family [Candidatus Nitrotoga sp. MKT]|nr:MAG: 6-phosphogluconolactonase, cycloisomerase 2 family [Candidatus Nitrotoga sp. MKT]